MESEDKYIGKQIGNYRITSLLGSGSFGLVYKGIHLYLANRVVAIKLLHLTYLRSAQERDNFLQEAQFLELLKHPNILPIHDVGIDEGFPYLVAEFAPNGSLRDRIEPQRLPIQESLIILTQVGQALQYVHEQHIVHRDLKPENILFNTKGQAMIADFGIAVFLETKKTKYVDVIGSPLYMAPEQFEGLASRRSDQYALACIAYELVTGEPPFVAAHAVALGMKHQSEQPRSPAIVNPDVPPHVAQAILKALAKNRDDRYPDTASFIAALLSVPTGSLQMTREQWLDEGNRLFNIRHYAEALNAFERSIQLDPSFADAHDGMGSALYYLGRSTEARTAYEQAIRLDPHYAMPYNGIGHIIYDHKRYNDALRFYEQAIQLDPKLVDAYVGKGNALYHLKRYEESLTAYEQAIQLDPGNLAAYGAKSWALRQLMRYSESLAACEQAIQLDPDNASTHTSKARTLFRLKRYGESLKCFDRALQLDPNLAEAHDFKADTLYHMRQFEAALASYERASQLDPKLASAHEGKGDVLFQFKRYSEALVAYEKAIELQSQFGIFHYKKGDALKMLGRVEEAEPAYEKARQLGYKVT